MGEAYPISVTYLSDEISPDCWLPMPAEPVFIACESVEPYVPRNPERSLLYGVVAGHLETFLARQRERGRTVPWFVEKELRILPKANHIQFEAKLGSNAETPTLRRFVLTYFTTIQDWLAKRVRGFRASR